MLLPHPREVGRSLSGLVKACGAKLTSPVSPHPQDGFHKMWRPVSTYPDDSP